MSSPPAPSAGAAPGSAAPGSAAPGSAAPGSAALAPLDYSLPDWLPNQPLRPRSRPQLVAGVVMYLCALWLAFEDVPFRRFEARLATPIAGLITGGHGFATNHAIVFFALGTPRAFGLEITEECTSALLLIPLLVMMGSFTIFSRVALQRQVFALAVGAALMMIVNVLRVAGIAFATWKWGLDPGYKYSHVFVGSAFSLIGFVGAMLLALWVLIRTERIHDPVLRRATARASTPPPAPDEPPRRRRVERSSQ